MSKEKPAKPSRSKSRSNPAPQKQKAPAKRPTGAPSRRAGREAAARKSAATAKNTAQTPEEIEFAQESEGPLPAFTIVGVGASAGGLEALGQLLHALPPSPG